jgi:hypothetical protein
MERAPFGRSVSSNGAPTRKTRHRHHDEIKAAIWEEEEDARLAKTRHFLSRDQHFPRSDHP